MKKLFCLFLSAIIVLAMCPGCGSEEVSSAVSVAAEVSVASSEPEMPVVETEAVVESVANETETEDVETALDVDVDKNLFDVEITIPADYLDEGTTQESLNLEVEEMGYKSATLNPDGSVTYTITKDQHAEMMKTVKESIDAGLEELMNSDEYTFVSIEANDNYTEFTATVSGEELGFGDVIGGMLFFMYGGMYNCYNGTTVDNVCVTYISEVSGEVIEVANSSDAG